MRTWTTEDFERLWKEVDEENPAPAGVDKAGADDTCCGSLFLNIPGEKPVYLGRISIDDLSKEKGDMTLFFLDENGNLVFRLVE